MIYKINQQTIICNDCLKQLSEEIKDNSIDIIVTSPPYNIGKEYNSYKDNQPLKVYLDWLGEIFKQLKRVLKDDGSFFLNIGSTCKEPWRAYEVGQKATEYFSLQNDIVWVKSISLNDESYGHFKPIVSNRFLNQQHESIFHFTKTANVPVDRLAIGVPYKDKSNIARWKHSDKEKLQDKRCRGNVWFIPYETVRSEKTHKAAFPVKLPEMCIGLHGYSTDTVVLDPFLGSGSTLLACQKLGVNGIGIELDEHYCIVAKENLV